MRTANSAVIGWQLSGLEFQIIWDALGRDRLPYPLRFRPTAETMDELTDQRARAGVRVRSVLGDRLHQALGILANPSARVEISGFHGPVLGTVTRLHGAVSGDVAVLAAQRPGEHTDTGSDVTLTLGRASELSRTMVERLPACTAGSERGLAIRQTKHVGGESLMRSPGSSHEAGVASRFFGRPRTSIGEISAYPGAAVDGRPSDDGVTFHWYDYRGDGRYIVTGGETIAARAASAADLEAEISRNLASVLRIPFNR